MLFGSICAERTPRRCVIAEILIGQQLDLWDHTSQTIIKQHDEIWSEVRLRLQKRLWKRQGRSKVIGGCLGLWGVWKGRMVRLGVDSRQGGYISLIQWTWWNMCRSFEFWQLFRGYVTSPSVPEGVVPGGFALSRTKMPRWLFPGWDPWKTLSELCGS